MASPPAMVPALPTQRLFDAGVSPLRLFAAASVGLLALLLCVEALLGRLSQLAAPGAAREIRIALVLALLVGYLPAALAWSARGLRQQLAVLRAAFPSARAALEAASAAAGSLPARRARLAAGFGALFGLAVPFGVDRDPGLYLRPDYWRPESVFHWILLPVVSASVARVGAALWTDSRRLSALALRLEGIDLFDLGALAPFSRHGLRIALLALLLMSILSILVTDRGFAPLLVGGALTVLGFATGALLLPVLGVHRRIREEKQAELARVRAAIRGDRRALEQTRVRGWAGVSTLADLLAYEARISAVPDWPFDAPTLARFGLYLLIPLGSWLGGALVERLLGWALG